MAEEQTSYIMLDAVHYICSACMDPFNALDIIARLPCGHTCHLYCMFMVKSASCPLCRVNYERQILQTFKRVDDYKEQAELSAAQPILQPEIVFFQTTPPTSPSPAPRRRRNRRSRHRNNAHATTSRWLDENLFIDETPERQPVFRRQNAYSHRS